MTGPAWNYILFRGRFTSKSDNIWTRFFTPQHTVVIFVAVCFGIESMQYFELYEATFDPWDFIAYVSILVPVFVLDLVTSEERTEQGVHRSEHTKGKGEHRHLRERDDC